MLRTRLFASTKVVKNWFATCDVGRKPISSGKQIVYDNILLYNSCIVWLIPKNLVLS